MANPTAKLTTATLTTFDALRRMMIGEVHGYLIANGAIMPITGSEYIALPIDLADVAFRLTEVEAVKEAERQKAKMAGLS